MGIHRVKQPVIDPRITQEFLGQRVEVRIDHEAIRGQLESVSGILLLLRNVSVGSMRFAVVIVIWNHVELVRDLGNGS